MCKILFKYSWRLRKKKRATWSPDSVDDEGRETRESTYIHIYTKKKPKVFATYQITQSTDLFQINCVKMSHWKLFHFIPFANTSTNQKSKWKFVRFILKIHWMKRVFHSFHYISLSFFFSVGLLVRCTSCCIDARFSLPRLFTYRESLCRCYECLLKNLY